VVALKVIRGILGAGGKAIERVREAGGVGGLVAVIARAGTEVGSSQGRELFVEAVLLIAQMCNKDHNLYDEIKSDKKLAEAIQKYMRALEGTKDEKLLT
jgi:hypothetical protein